MNILDTPAFGVLMTIITYEIGVFIYKKSKISLFNPILISLIIIIAIMSLFKIDFSTYKKGGDIISFFLAPCTIILAIPLYRQIHVLRKNIKPIMIGVVTGSLTSVISVAILAKILGLKNDIILSLLSKSVTTPIGIEITKQVNGIVPITVIVIAITGISGAMFGTMICKIFGIKDKVAVGIAIGTASHAVGTSKAVELGETEGAMSGLAIGLAGIVTVIIVPIIAIFIK